jgi:hypothetical protein
MQVNPYEPRQVAVDDSADGVLDRDTLVRVAGVLGGLVVCGCGILWIRVLRRTPSDVGPVAGTLAQIVVYSGIAIAFVGVVGQICAAVNRWSKGLTSDDAIVIGWNCIPASFSFLLAAAWFAIGGWGLYVQLMEVVNYNYYRGSSVGVIAPQCILFGSGLAAALCCWTAGLPWMRRNYSRASLFSVIGVLGPIVAYVMLFRVLRNLIGYLIRV